MVRNDPQETNKQKCSPLLQTLKPPTHSPHQRPSNFHLHRSLTRVELRKPKLGPETIQYLPQDKQSIQRGSGELTEINPYCIVSGGTQTNFFSLIIDF